MPHHSQASRERRQAFASKSALRCIAHPAHLRPGSVALWLTLCTYAGEPIYHGHERQHMMIRPELAAIAVDAGISGRELRRRLTDLEAAGMVRRHVGRRGTTVELLVDVYDWRTLTGRELVGRLDRTVPGGVARRSSRHLRSVPRDAAPAAPAEPDSGRTDPAAVRTDPAAVRTELSGEVPPIEPHARGGDPFGETQKGEGARARAGDSEAPTPPLAPAAPPDNRPEAPDGTRAIVEAFREGTDPAVRARAHDARTETDPAGALLGKRPEGTSEPEWLTRILALCVWIVAHPFHGRVIVNPLELERRFDSIEREWVRKVKVSSADQQAAKTPEELAREVQEKAEKQAKREERERRQEAFIAAQDAAKRAKLLEQNAKDKLEASTRPKMSRAARWGLDRPARARAQKASVDQCLQATAAGSASEASGGSPDGKARE